MLGTGLVAQHQLQSSSQVMTSQKSIFRIFEFFSHNLKEHHEIPLNLQNKLKVLRIG